MLDFGGNTALHIACKGEKEELVKLFLDFNANVKLKNETGKTPFDLIKKNKSLNKSNVFWEMNDKKYEN